MQPLCVPIINHGLLLLGVRPLAPPYCAAGWLVPLQLHPLHLSLYAGGNEGRLVPAKRQVLNHLRRDGLRRVRLHRIVESNSLAAAVTVGEAQAESKAVGTGFRSIRSTTDAL